MWNYKVGFSVKEFNEIAGKNLSTEEVGNLLSEKGFEYRKVIVGEALKEAIPECMNAVYKNPSSIKEDAPGAFSCSSLISYLFVQAGVWMPSLSIDKYVFGTPISKEELQFGDLIFSNTGNGKIRYETVEWLPGTKVPEGVDHVGLYMGDNEVLHATKKAGKVVVESVEDFESSSKIVGFRRMANINEERFVVTVPEEREDLKNREHLVSEIGQKTLVFNTQE